MRAIAVAADADIAVEPRATGAIHDASTGEHESVRLGLLRDGGEERDGDADDEPELHRSIIAGRQRSGTV